MYRNKLLLCVFIDFLSGYPLSGSEYDEVTRPENDERLQETHSTTSAPLSTPLEQPANYVIFPLLIILILFCACCLKFSEWVHKDLKEELKTLDKTKSHHAPSYLLSLAMRDLSAPVMAGNKPAVIALHRGATDNWSSEEADLYALSEPEFDITNTPLYSEHHHITLPEDAETTNEVYTQRSRNASLTEDKPERQKGSKIGRTAKELSGSMIHIPGRKISVMPRSLDIFGEPSLGDGEKWKIVSRGSVEQILPSVSLPPADNHNKPSVTFSTNVLTPKHELARISERSSRVNSAHSLNSPKASHIAVGVSEVNDLDEDTPFLSPNSPEEQRKPIKHQLNLPATRKPTLGPSPLATAPQLPPSLVTTPTPSGLPSHIQTSPNRTFQVKTVPTIQGGVPASEGTPFLSIGSFGSHSNTSSSSTDGTASKLDFLITQLHSLSKDIEDDIKTVGKVDPQSVEAKRHSFHLEKVRTSNLPTDVSKTVTAASLDHTTHHPFLPSAWTRQTHVTGFADHLDNVCHSQTRSYQVHHKISHESAETIESVDMLRRSPIGSSGSIGSGQ